MEDPERITPYIPSRYETIAAQIGTILSSGDERAIAALLAVVNALYGLVSGDPGNSL